ncbi:Glycoside hydrolase, 38 vacuolar alpha mannosidase [Coemansia asiatica]|uniref:Glycoside hydrolase, 38 vacuolar alpha mannosidase n=1 Tax=Coemansia asiatica TaxID=1052880 RepID=A0A9W7XPT1_9FUNG|nr:Glycoside hydrolase, 38 vacuolar alpha mannosidase [Coemansia asiatica]
MMCLHDVLIFWDAWDIKINHLHKFSMMDASSITIINEGPLLSSIAIEIPVGKSSKMKHYVSLSAVSSHLDFDCNVNWHESHKCLKTAFTWDICSKFATYKTQYSVVQRPTHHNTTWDMAKFRVCAHKFGDLSEFGYGIALLNDSKYGYVMLDSTMTIILLRSPKLPNANCDMGHQSFCYTVYPHQEFNELRVVQEAYQFNVPLVQLPVDMQVAAASKLQGSLFFAVSDMPNVVLDMVKTAEDRSHDVIVCLYKAYGSHGKAVLMTKLAFGGVAKTNILEEKMESLDLKVAAAGSGKDQSMVVNIKPFEVVTLRFKA